MCLSPHCTTSPSTLFQTKTQTQTRTHTHTHIQPRFIASDHTPHELTSLAGKRERERERKWVTGRKTKQQQKAKRAKRSKKSRGNCRSEKNIQQKRIKALATTQNYSSADCQAASSFSGYYFENGGSHFVVLFFLLYSQQTLHYLKQKSKRETK